MEELSMRQIMDLFEGYAEFCNTVNDAVSRRAVTGDEHVVDSIELAQYVLSAHTVEILGVELWPNL